jgi:hypothetical protein
MPCHFRSPNSDEYPTELHIYNAQSTYHDQIISVETTLLHWLPEDWQSFISCDPSCFSHDMSVFALNDKQLTHSKKRFFAKRPWRKDDLFADSNLHCLMFASFSNWVKIFASLTGNV